MTGRAALEGKRILVLEDDFYLASDEQALLEAAGATVVGPFGSGCGEEDLAAAGPVDAAVVDINLGGGPTYVVARALSERGVPFVFVTGYDAAVIPPDFAGVPRLEKPIQDQELVAAVATLVERTG